MIEKKQPLPTWLLCVWDNSWMKESRPDLRRVYQIDMVDDSGENHGSTNPDALRAEGYEIPDLSELPQGQHSFADILCVK